MKQAVSEQDHANPPPAIRSIFCCACQHEVNARLTTGTEIYPHRPDLASLPFWRCDTCRNYVGCHHKTSDRTRPLGNIPTAEIRKARQHIHAILDPIWKSGKMRRREVYERVSKHIGRSYHTSEIRSIEEARTVYEFVREMAA